MDATTRALRDHLKGLILRVCNVQGVTAEQIGDEAILFGTAPLDLTSLDAIEIAVAIEYEFSMRLKDVSTIRSYFRSIATIADLVKATAEPAILQRVLHLAA